MRHNLGSRRRFLFRLVIYLLTPLLGLAIIMSPAPETDEVPAGGTWLGWIAVSVGLVAQYLLLSRLQQPLGAVRYAFQSQRVLSQLIQRELQHLSGEINIHELNERIKKRLASDLPDVLFEDAYIELAGAEAMIIGNENILVFIPSPKVSAQAEEIAQAAATLRRPLSSDKLLMVLSRKTDSELKKELQSLISNSRFFEPN